MVKHLGNNAWQVNISHLAAGVYLLQIKTDKGVVIIDKVVKE